MEDTQASRNILVVDDEEPIRKLVAHVLETLGYKVRVARHSEEALEMARLQAEPIHLLLTDVRMDPHISGCKLAQALRPARPAMRVLYMSGYPESDVVRREVEAGLADFLPKPFTPTVLAERVARALGKLEAAGAG